MTLSRKSLLMLLLFAVHQAAANDDELLASETVISSTTTTTSSPLPPVSAANTLGILFRQARSENYNYAKRRFSDDTQDPSAATAAAAARVDPYERDPAYFEARCLTCDPNKAASLATTEREAYPARGWRQKGRYEYYNEDDMEDRDRRYRDRYDGYYNDRSNDRGRAPGYDYDRYDPYGRNELFKPSVYNDRYDPYERDRYYPRPDARPPLDRPISDRPVPDPRPMFDPRPYDPRSYERGNGYDNLDQRYPYDDRNSYDSRYYPTPPARRPGYEEYGPPRYDRDRYNGRNYGRYDSRYDRYDPYDSYDRNAYGRRPYDDRYGAPDRYGGGRSPPPGDSRGYYGGGGSAGGGSWSGGAADRPAYASAWNYAGGNRDNWRDVGRDRDRDRDRDRNREHDRDSAFYRPRDYWYDSTAAPGGGTSYLYDRTETTTKPNSDKATSPPQVQDNNKTSYKD